MDNIGISSDTESEIRQALEKAMAMARDIAMSSEEYRNCGFRVGSKVMVCGYRKPCTVSDILMLYDPETLEPKLSVTIRSCRGTERKIDYRKQIASVIEY